MKFTALQLREVFHLEFLREFVKTVPASAFVLKGGSNLRFFFSSVRYSEDMDIDIRDTPVHHLQERCRKILESRSLLNRLRSFGIDEVVPPDMRYAKQTQTVQRFKIHLIVSSEVDLFTKIEFSRRGFDPEYKSEAVGNGVLGAYYLPPLILPHYTAPAVLKQKINALVARRRTEARDVFDLYIIGPRVTRSANLPPEKIRIARDRIYSIDYRQYRDQIVEYLAAEDRNHYDSPETWDEIRLSVLELLK